MLFCTSCFCVIGCGSDDDGPKVEYNITVLSPDQTPLQGVTVSWKKSGKTKGSAKTGDDGLAAVKIPQGTYNVVLSGMADGLTYTEISVTPDVRVGLSVTLTVMRVTYTAEVKDKTGAAAQNVTVTWSSGSTVADSAVTGADGKASCELDYGEYTVTVSNLPDGNVYTDTKTVTGKAPNAVIELREGATENYTVTVRSEGGLKFKDVSVFIYSGTKPIYSGKTDDNGVLVFSLPADNYTVRVPSVQDAYTVKSTPNLTATVRQGDVVLSSSVITDAAPADKIYKIGDIIHDYEWTTPYEVDGQKITYSIAELLETKEAVIINNWGTKCTYCVEEMPAMEEVYQKYNDKIELLAISNYLGGDSESTIVSYREENEYTFPMMRDNNSFATRFQITGFPTTIVIDRYGAIAHIESGAIPAVETWELLIKQFIGDDYVQTFTPGEDNESITSVISRPDITVPADHYKKIGQAINNFTATDDMYVEWYGETASKVYWPFLLKTEEGVSETDEVLCSSNVKKPSSMSALFAAVKMPVGKVLAFDYYCQTETADVLSVAWDGLMTIKQISGNSPEWKTCYLYAELDGDEHGLALSYIKDSTVNVGLDNVYIRNVRFEDMSAIDEDMDMPRTAAYGVPSEGATEYSYYAGVELVDGYYHVKRDTLQNNEYAGNDEKPMLFMNMLGPTKWSSASIAVLITDKDDAGEYSVDCKFSVNGGAERDYRDIIAKYCSISAASDIYGLLPVDDELRDIISAFIAKVEGGAVRQNGWLELCMFYSHYGDDGEYIGNPILGLTTKTAIPVEIDTVTTANLNRIMGAVTTEIYSFTPEESAVYKIESLLPEGQKASQVWLYDDSTDVEHPLVYDGDERFIRDGVNEQNFVLYRYLTAGHKYYIEVALLMQELGDMDFKVTNVGQSVTELVPCSEGTFDMILGPKEELLGIELAGAVSYYKDDDGFYRVGDASNKHDDDPYIYLDVKYPTRISPTLSLTQLADQKLKIPTLNAYCDYYTFDFRYTIAYTSTTNDEGTITNYTPKFDLVGCGIDRDFADYTAKIKEYIAGADDGLVKVNDELVKILKLFIETRVNRFENGEYEEALDNEWLRFCWYYKTHDAQNP